MKKKLLLPSILLTHLLLYTACGQKQLTNIDYEQTTQPVTNVNTSVSTPTIEYTSPSISSTSSSNGIVHQLPSIQGDTITIEENGNVGFSFPQFKGKIIIFEIFGKTCDYCFEEMPIIERIKKEFPSNVEIIAIQAQDRMSPSVASTIISQNNIDYPIIEGDDAKEILRFLAETYAWRGVLPYVLLIKDGTTEYTFPDGGVSYEELKESVESLL